MGLYYQQRASSGLIITEATAISEEGSGWRNAPHITTQGHADAWRSHVVDPVQEKGGVIYLQLWHMGRQAHSSHHPSTGRTVSASAIAAPGIKVKTVQREDAEPEVPHALTVEEIQATIQDYVHAAKLAASANFDGIEIHTANGYLIDQFLQSCSNTRQDEYGGTIEKRTRLLVEIVQAIIDSGAFPASRIGFRISPNGAFGGMGSDDNYEQFLYVAKTMNQFDLAYLHIMDGLGFGAHGKCRYVKCSDIRKVFDKPIISNVGLTKGTAEGMIRSGACDACAFGRLYISNPDLVERFANGWELEKDADYQTFWQPTGAKGYTDWPVVEKCE